MNLFGGERPAQYGLTVSPKSVRSPEARTIRSSLEEGLMTFQAVVLGGSFEGWRVAWTDRRV
jgi:hypothetical protein